MKLKPTPACGPATITKTVTILEPPTANAVVSLDPANGCAPVVATFTNQSQGYQVSYNWTVSPGQGWMFINNTSASSTSPVIRFTNPGTYTVTLTATNVCSTDTWTTTVVVKSKPNIILPNLGPFCQSASLSFSAPSTQIQANGGTISSVNWSFPGGTPSSSSSQFPSGINYSATVATTFTYTVTATNECGPTTVSETFDIQVPATLSLPPNTTVCANASPTQLMATPSGGTWTGPGVSPAGVFNPAAAGGPGVKTLTYTYGSGVCTATGTVQITVEALPSVNAGAQLQVCVSETALPLGGTPAGGTWTSSAPGVVNGATFNPQASGAGTFTLTYTVTSAAGCSASATRTVVVHPLPPITVSNATYCNTPGTVPLPSASPAGGTWSGPCVSGSMFDPSACGIGTYVVTYTVTNANQCTNSATATLTVTNATAVNAGPNLTVCLSAPSINLTSGATPAGGTWSTTSSGLSGPNFNPAAAGAGTHTLTYTVGAGNCAVTSTRVITVNPLPVVNAGTNLGACISAASLALNGTPAGGTWTSSGAGVVAGTTFNPAQSGAGIFTLTYTVTDANGCSNSSSITVTVNNLPVITTQDTTYCNTPGSVPLPFVSPSGGAWSGPGISGTQFNPNTAGGVGAYTATYTYTHPTTQCTNTETITIQVIDPATVAAGPNVAVCISAPTINLASGASPAGGTWSTTSSGLSGPNFNPAAAGAGTHTLTYTVGAGNCAVTSTRIITVNALPVTNAGTNLGTCISATSLALNGTPAGGTWTSSGAGVVAGTTFSPAQSGAGMFTLTYTVTDANGCSNSSSITVTVNNLPVITTQDTTYCNTPGSVPLPFVSPAGGAWSGPGISSNQFNPNAAGGVGSYTATYTYTHPTTQCTNTETITIEVIDPATVAAGPNVAVCISAPTINIASGASPAGGTWSTTSSGLSGSNFNPAAAGAGTHTLVYTVGAGNCAVSSTRVITVNSLPVVMPGAYGPVCVDALPVNLTGMPAGGTWTTAANGLSGTSFNPALSGDGTFTLTYTVTDNNGCTKSEATSIVVHPLPVVTAADTVYCNTPGTVTLPWAAPAGGMWSGPGISGIQFDPQGAGGVNAYSAVYTFTNATTQCTNRDTVTIEVINPQMINAGIDTAFCESVTAFNLGAGGVVPAVGAWTTTSNGLSGTTFNPQAAGPGVHVLTYSVGVGNCLVSDMRNITVWELPTVNAGADQQACVSDSALALTPAPAGGVWTTTPALQLSGNSVLVNASGTGVYTVIYTFVDNNNCVNADQSIVTIHALPVVMASDTTFCNTPGTVTLPVAAPTGGTWAGQGISDNAFDPVAAGGVGDYPAVYTFTDQNSCTNADTALISVINPPAINAGFDDTLCISDGVLSLTGFVPGSGGVWTGPGIANAQVPQFDPLLAGGGPHFITHSFGVGNCLVRDTARMLVIDVAVEAGPNRTACLDDAPLTLTGFSPSGGTWTGSGITAPAGVFSSAAATAGIHVLTYEYADPVLGCLFRDSLTVLVHPMPESDFAQPANSCIDVPIVFLNQSQSTFITTWSFGDGATSTAVNPVHTYSDTGTYVVTLITENQFGCVDTAQRTIFVTEPPHAEFVATPDSGCAVLDLTLTNLSYGFQTNYAWNFGNGQSSTAFDPGVVSYQQGTRDTVYTIILTAQNLCATRTWTDSVKVFPWPLVSFGTTLDTICTGETLAFTNLTLGNPETFLWDFGNGLTSTDSLPAPVQFFTDSIYRTYTIRLIATNFCGSDTAEYPVVVKPVDVDAFFNMPSAVGCQPYTVAFTNFSTPGAAVSWDFGDGNTAAVPNPVHTFAQAGVFQVVQRASSGCGYDSTVATVTVLPAPAVSFSSAPQVCRADTLAFTNTSEPLAGTTWAFGDGDTSLLYNPGHAWTASGTYTVTLTGVAADNGCAASFSAPVIVLALPVPAFAPSVPDGCVPLTVAFANQSVAAAYYEWDFGDGNSAVGAAPQHVYVDSGAYAVRLRAIDLNGCRTDSTLRYITVHPVPTPGFTVARDQLCGVPVTATLTNTTPDAVGYQWTFGNGSGSTFTDPQVTYVAAGDYPIALVATNVFGCRDTAEQLFSAYAAPVADFTVEPGVGCAPLTVTLTNASDFTTAAYWSLSDGRVFTGDSVLATFPLAGTYGVTLVASHRDVCFDTLAQPAAVVVRPSPVANFAFEEVQTTPPSGEFEFTDLSTDAVQWAWDFGDGGTSDEQHPMWRYFSNGEKTVTLLVTSANGCTDDTVQTIVPRRIRGLFVPNAFSPGVATGDAALFLPKGVGLKEYEIAVYSSFGELLWSSDKLAEGQPAEGWDGTFRGELLPQDVYVWQVKKAIFDDGSVWEGNGAGGKKVGSVVLIR